MTHLLGQHRFQRLLLRALAFGMAVAVVRWLPAQSLTPATPSSAGQSPQSTAGTSPDDGAATWKINFPSTPIVGILPTYTELTQRKLILDSSLQGETMKIVGNRPLTRKEAINFIEASLLLNGYALVEVDKETSKLIHASGGKDPSAEGLPVIVSIRDLPQNEQIVYFVMPLQHISPEEATKAFTTVVKLHSYGAITAVNNTSNVIIKENTTTIRSIFDLAQQIDVPPADIANELIELKRSDAEGIAEIIQDIYEEKEKSSAPSAPTSVAGAVAPAPNPGLQGGAPTPGGAGSTAANTNPTAAKVKIIPHRRTNSILVIARPVDIANIKALVEKLDREAGESNFMERKLKYMPVTEFLAVARDALSRDTDIESDSGSSGGSSKGSTRSSSSSGKSSRRSHSSSSSGNDGSTAQRNNAFQNGFNSGGSLGGGTTNQHASLDDPEQEGAPESVVVGKTLLIADARSNTLIVNGSPEHINIVDKLIERMDVRPQQIYISTIIGQLNLGDTYDYGLDLLKGLDDFTLRSQPKSGTGTTTTTTTTTGTNATATAIATGQIAAQPAGTPGLIEMPLNFKGFEWDKFNLYGQIGALGRYVHLLEGNKNFKVLNRPSMTVRNNQKATITNGQKIAVPISSLSNVGSIGGTAAVSSSIDYRDVVLRLEVVPLINSDDEVTLRILQVNDNVVGQQTVGGNSIPTIGTQEIETTVSVKDGSTVVLGGLITEREQHSENGVLFLRRIPVLKHLFNRTEKSTTREELLIFIQPKIIRSSDPLDLPNYIESGRSKVFDESLRFGTETPEVRKALIAK